MPEQIIQVRLHPGAKKSVVQPPGAEGDPWEIWVRAPAVEGKANEALIEVLSDHFNCAKSKITLLKGHTSRLKRLSVPR